MKFKIIIICIFLLAGLLRFWQLGNNPPSLDWDEAALGYNAYSILKTGKDEYGELLPLSLRSFGDYKPPLYTYLTILPVWMFDLNEFSTRFPSALFGTLSVIVAYYLIKELFPNSSKKYHTLFTFLFAISPWHLQFSRIAFEANVALFFFMSGTLFFLKGLYRSRYLYLSSFLYALCIYAYHSPRLILPIFLAGLLIIYRKEIILRWKEYLFASVIFLLLISPVVIELKNSTSARFGSVTILNSNEILPASQQAAEEDEERKDFLGKLVHNRRVTYARYILAGYLDHFNFDFLFLYGDSTGRHHAADMGMLYIWEFIFILIGIYTLFSLRSTNKHIYLILLWFLVAPISSSITKATPHAVRALYYLPTYYMFIASGLFLVLQSLANKKILQKIFVVSLSSIMLLNFYYYMHTYWIHSPIEHAREWQYGYKQVIEEVAKLEHFYDKIIITPRYDQPYIYVLFYNKVDPLWYQSNWGSGEIQRFNRQFGKYEFREINWETDSQLSNTLLVGSTIGEPDEMPSNPSGLIKEIYFPDGSVAFRIVGR